MSVRGQPPGRAGRMWLDRRLGIATRGRDLLEQKLRILLGLQDRFALLDERTRSDWDAAVRELELWVARAGLVSGQRGLQMACDDQPVRAEISWKVTMGLRHPASAAIHLPEVQATRPVPDSAALIEAREAARRVVRAGIDRAVAERALAEVRAEVASTRRQLRAVQRRWIPRLEQARTSLVMALEDQEHDESLRLRWSAGRGRRIPP